MNSELYTEGILSEIKTIIRSDISAGAERPQNEYLDWCLEKLKQRYQSANKWSRYKAWTLSDRREITKIWVKYKPQALKEIEDYTKACKSRKLTKEIKSASAYAIIKAAMRNEGLKFQYYGQAHRAKVIVLLTPDRTLTIYIPYKTINEQLPQVMESLRLIKTGLDSLGKNTKINKAYYSNQWE